MKKILTIGNLNSIFTVEFVTEILLKIPNVQVDIMSELPDQSHSATIVETLNQLGCGILHYYTPALCNARGYLGRIRRGIKRYQAHRRVAGDYDLVHINSVSVFSFVAALHARKDARLVVSYWGSDLLRASKLALLTMRPLLKRADAITVETNYVKKRLSELFDGRFDNKALIATFGTKNAEILHDFLQKHDRTDCKRIKNLPTNKLCVFCGYNGNRTQRHIEIVRVLNTLPNEVKEKLCMVLHCGYGLEEDYHEELNELVSDCDIECRLITDYMRGTDLAALRMCADVMLNLQPTDSISTTMLETLEAGAIVIKGDWLTYPELDECGVYMLSIPSLEALPELIRKIVDDTERYREETKRNKGVVLMQSWDTVRDGWMKALGEN